MKKAPHESLLHTLRCPICKQPMDFFSAPHGSASLICQGIKRHCYDFSSGGYVNLMPPGRANGGDSKAAVRARTDFLNTELYSPLAQEICGILQKHHVSSGDLVVDAGCGEGYYSSALIQSGYSVMGFDLSKFAADTAAKRSARLNTSHSFFGVASVFELPLADACASALVNVFAPCSEKEYCRVLKDGGLLAVAYAGPEHLMGLKQALYAQTKANDERHDLPLHMPLLSERRIRFSISVHGREAIQNLFAMTPYYWRTSPQDCQKLSAISQLNTEVDVIIAVYQKTFQNQST